MRTININGVSFQWKLTSRVAKTLGLAGPGDSEGMQAMAAKFIADFEEAQRVVLAGCANGDQDRIAAAIEEWSVPDDFQAFIEQALGPKPQASEPAIPQ